MSDPTLFFRKAQPSRHLTQKPLGHQCVHSELNRTTIYNVLAPEWGHTLLPRIKPYDYIQRTGSVVSGTTPHLLLREFKPETSTGLCICVQQHRLPNRYTTVCHHLSTWHHHKSSLLNDDSQASESCALWLRRLPAARLRPNILDHSLKEATCSYTMKIYGHTEPCISFLQT